MSLGICWEGAEQVFTREFGYMLGAGRSMFSLGSLVYVGKGVKQAFTRELYGKLCFATNACIWLYWGGGGGGGAKQAFTRGEQAFSWEFGKNSVLPFVHISVSTRMIYGFNFKEYGRLGYFKKTSVHSIDKLKPWIHHIQKWSSVKLHREKKTGYTCVVNSCQGKVARVSL